MDTRFGQVQERLPEKSGPQITMQNGNNRPPVKEIPYDYVATFILEGRARNRIQDVINISVDGAFVAVSVGYSFIPRQDEARVSGILQNAATAAGLAASSTTIAGRLLSIFQPFLSPLSAARGQPQAFLPAEGVAHCLAMRLCGIHFKYSIIDSATGRELQNKPIHNIAGLGEATGERPFRPLAKPMLFMPRSTIRIEIEEISSGLFYEGAELFIVLHGYKLLGIGAGLP